MISPGIAPPRPHPVVCAISASDSSAHAGQQCDLRVIQDLGCHGVSVISAMTAQNSTGIEHIQITGEDSFCAQVKALHSDLNLSVLKTGLLLSSPQVREVLALKQRTRAPLIVDPVMRASSGTDFGEQALLRQYTQLLAHADLLTPNIPEAEQLLQTPIQTPDDITNAARCLMQRGAKAVLLKGGHSDLNPEFVYDYYCDSERQFWMRQPRRTSPHRRGTGCALASATASFMARGKDRVDAVVLASAYIQRGIDTGFAVGQGPGLLGNGGWPNQLNYFPQLAEQLQQFDTPAYSSCGSRQLGIYPIVDSLLWLRRLLPLGVSTLQLRIKDQTGEQLEQTIRDAVQLGRHYGARLFINDHWQLAIKHRAYGVHLGQEDMDSASLECIQRSGLRLGLSSHSEYEWLRAASLRPSYIAMGSVFTTRTKQVKTIGLNNLSQWSQVLGRDFPLVAIGGIDASNIDAIIERGVDGAAVISAITGAADWAAAARVLLEKMAGAGAIAL